MNSTSKLVEELIRLNDTQIKRIDEDEKEIDELQKQLNIKNKDIGELEKELIKLKEQLEQNTIIETSEDIKISSRSSIKEYKEDKIKYGRLVKCFRNNRYFYIREIFVDGKKLNIPLI
tara:strand:+ start:75 stop:428 length:354 start_codon:yes stop_codon:yes gene_type:complete